MDWCKRFNWCDGVDWKNRGYRSYWKDRCNRLDRCNRYKWLHGGNGMDGCYRMDG